MMFVLLGRAFRELTVFACIVGDETPFEQRTKVQARAVQARTNRAFRQVQAARNFVEPEIEMVMCEYHVAMLVRQIGERAANAFLALLLGRPGVTLVLVISVARREETIDFFQVHAVGHSCVLPALGAHQHERFVRRDAIDPSRDVAFPAERAESSHDLHERHLKNVPAVLGGQRVASELLYERGSDLVQKGLDGAGVAIDCALYQRTIGKLHGLVPR